MKKTHIPRFVAVFLIFCSLLAVTSSGHSGDTDEYGGHYNTETGEYHYHHGYPAHQHTGGYCPYYKSKLPQHGNGTNSSRQKLYKNSDLGELGKFLDHLDEVEREKKSKEAELKKKYGNISQEAIDFLESLPDEIKSVTKKSYLEAQAKRLWEKPIIARERAEKHSFSKFDPSQFVVPKIIK